MTSINTTFNDDYSIFNSIYWWLSDAKKDELLDLLKKDKEEREKQKENKIENIVKELKENNVVTEENAEMLWLKWKKIHINLPETWYFKWYKFDCFVSNEHMKEKELESNHELIENSFNMEEITKLIKALNFYLYEKWIWVDRTINIEKQMKFWDIEHITKKDWIKLWKRETLRIETWEILKRITWLNWMFWVNNKVNTIWRDAQVWWFFHHDFCFFNNSWMWSEPVLLKTK